MCRARLALAAAASSFLLAANVGASDLLTAAPRTDNHVAARDVRTGALVWDNRSFRVTSARFEMYAERLVVVTRTIHPDGTLEARAPVDPDTGRIVAPAGDQLGTLLSWSGTWRPKTLRFTNGWWVRGFDPGYDKAIRLVDENGVPKWALQTAFFPERAAAWRQLIYWDEGRHPSSGRLHAHEIGASEESWQVDFETITGQARVDSFAVVGRSLYVQSGTHVCELDPASGQLRHHWDLVSLSGVEPDELTLDPARGVSITRDRETLVVAFDRRLFAIDRKTSTLLWHHPTGSWPSRQYPLAHRGRVYFLTGPGASRPEPAPSASAMVDEDGAVAAHAPLKARR